MPHTHAVDAVLQVHIITVSTSRGAAEDRSGPVLRDLCEGAGHLIAAHAIVPDDPEAIGTELDRALGSTTVDLVLLTGGTGISARDCTPEVVRSRLTRELPGFGELFRSLSYAEVGSAAMLSTALGGVARGHRLVFALPGSPNACRLAMEKLILPELGHLVGELRKETPLPKKSEVVRPVVRTRVPEPAPVPPLESPAILAPPRKGLDVVQTPTPAPTPDSEAPRTGWQGALAAMGGKLVPPGSMTLPDSLAAIPAVMDVLGSAQSRMKLVADDGRTWLVFGFPDLLRPTSKVLAIREALPVAEVVALHRWPARVGLCCELDDTLLPRSDSSAAEAAEERTGREPDSTGSLFAVETNAVWVQERRYVRKWDGKRLGPEENVGPAIASLLLHWSAK